MTIDINREKMLEYFDNFDSFSHKYFKDKAIAEDPARREKVASYFYTESRRSHDPAEVMEIFQTMDKVYHYGSHENSREMNLLEQATDKFLVQYVDIDGMQELFRPSFFNFEWMMHLEYVQKKHDYSYYRDHYLHQIRNLYEMFILLQEKGLWRDCMRIYRQRQNMVANRMAESVSKQEKAFPEDGKELLKASFGDVDEWCYHYIIFSTAIVSALVHDIGYPITYMKRNLSTLQDFLPLSNLFMGLEDGIPRIKTLLSGSLLFETVDNSEIVRRLQADDHGAYSAIILLCQYYDNGKIFSLEPAKRMIIELSALVIYNHTLRHQFQSEKRYERHQNVFTDNPISYLFRLCDDLQEWERVYFEITGKGTFFICEQCKMPMIRRRNKSHNYELEEAKSGLSKAQYEYECCCGVKGINTTRFPYRRLMNVAPFTELTLYDYEGRTAERKRLVNAVMMAEETVTAAEEGVMPAAEEGTVTKPEEVIPAAKKGTETASEEKTVTVPDERRSERREGQKWILELKCNKGILLQLARYNPNFAVQRARGIRELRGLTQGQKDFPRIFVRAFVSNNPLAIKAEILRDFILKNEKIRDQIDTALKKHIEVNAYDEEKFSKECSRIITKIQKMPKQRILTAITDSFQKKYCDMREAERAGGADQAPEACKTENMDWIPLASISFYFFLIIFGNILSLVEFENKDGKNIDDKAEKKKREQYELTINARFTEYAEKIAAAWGITDPELIDLTADCITCMYGNISAVDFFEGKNTFRNNLRIPLRMDLGEILRKYTREPDSIKKKQEYDYCSDYYFFYIMDYLNLHS